MADCASLLDEELSSFVFNYLTENSDSQYGEEEVCSDRLDSDFPDIDLSQLDASDFDSVNCLSELHWCNDHATGASPASVHYSTADELFEIEEENAALLAALTDSLDGMVDAEVGGLSVFPTLGEGPNQEEEDDDTVLPLNTGDFSQSLGTETEDPSLLKKLLLTPPNVPTGADTQRDSATGHRHGNRGLHPRTMRFQVKSEAGARPQDRKPRAARPAGRLCTELHRHLTTGRGHEHAPDSEEGEDEEEDEDDDEEEESESDEGEEEESSGSDGEGVAALPPAAPPEPQFSSEKELHSVVELIRYMHTYCLPMRKQHAWDRKEREPPAPVRSRASRPEAPRAPAQNSHSRAAAGPPTATVGGGGGGGGPPAPRRIPFSRRREPKADSLLRVILERSTSFDVSKPYRLHSPPYAPAPAPPPPPSHQHTSSSPLNRTSCSSCSAPSSPERRWAGTALGPEEAWVEEEGGSFSVRRSRRLASFPSRFAKRLRPGHRRRPWGEEQEERRARVKGGGAGSRAEQPREGHASLMAARNACCNHENQACLCLPLHPKTTGESQFSSKSFEQTLAVDLCGTAGLTPPTTPPHKPVEDELFKPAEGVGGSGGESPTTSSSSSTSTGSSPGAPTRGPTSWLLRGQHPRKLPEQTELYAQLRREGPDGDGGEGEGGVAGVYRPYGDHDYCALSLGESRKRSAALLGAILRARDGPQGEGGEEEEQEEEEEEVGGGGGGRASGKLQEEQQTAVMSLMATSDRQSHAATPPASEEEEGERSSSSRSPSPVMDSSPGSPTSKMDSSEVTEGCPADRQRNKAKPDEDNCQVFYIHNLPSSVTHNMLRKRFQVFGSAQDCKVIIRNDERCGVIKIRQGSSERQRREEEAAFQSRANGLQRLSRKRYIDLDEAGPGPVKSKYDALDFDTLLKEAQKSLHR